jgi:Glycosyl hydrolase family 85
VFTGIDVYGRNTYGGGGFQTHLALRPIKQSGTSAAIFAPAWTVERCPPGTTDPSELEERFWTGPRGRFGRESVSQSFKERAVLTELPFATNFDPGWGPRTVKSGLVVDQRRYFNMSRQDIQPSFLRTVVASGDPAAASLALSQDVALHGSASVRLRYAFAASRMMSGTYTMVRLLVANLGMSPIAAAAAARPSNSAAGAVLSSPVSGSVVGSTSLSSTSATASSSSSSAAAAAAPGKQSLRVAYDYYVANDQPEAGDTFGLVLLLNSPPLAVLLVGEDSKWALEAPGAAAGQGAAGLSFGAGRTIISVNAPSPGEDATTAAAAASSNVRVGSRLQILGKYVATNVVTPTRQEAVLGPPARDPGRWYTRVFDLPPSLVAGQRLAEVLVVVGEPPIQPLSVSPSPFMTPSGSRAGSRFGSHVASRAASRLASRQGSRSTSRQGSRPGSRSGSPPRAGDLLARAEEIAGIGMMSQSRSFGGSKRRMSQNHVDMFDHNDGDQLMPQRSENAANGASHRAELSRPRDGGRRDSSYANAFTVGGTMDFEEMERNGRNDGGKGNWSASTSRALSRLSSRLGTPSGSRPVSRIHSRHISRQGSNQSSLAVSRTGSRAGSRFMSPARTPLTGGGGALPRVLSATLTGGVGGIRSGGNTPSRLSSTPLRDLKSALIHAAGSMAGVGSTGGEAADQGGLVTQVVYLGSLRMELYDLSEAKTQNRRTSSGRDGDFFNMDAPELSLREPTAVPSVTKIQRRLSRRHFV